MTGTTSDEERSAPQAPVLEPIAERLRFDSIVEGRAPRAVWTGHSFDRAFTP